GGSGTVTGAGVVFVGYGITSNNDKLKYDDYAEADVAGKVVLAIRKTPRAKNDKEPNFGTAANRIGAFTSKVNTAKSHKAAAVIFVNDAETAGTDDPLVTFNSAGPGTSSSPPVFFVRRAVADQLLKAAGTSLADAEKAIDENFTPKTVALEGVT